MLLPPEALHPYFLTHPHARDRFVGLVGCGKKKSETPKPARLLYTGNLTRVAVRWTERNCRRWCFLSAKHRVVSPATVLEPYELSLALLGEDERAAWVREVSEALLSRYGDVPYLCVAGLDYYRYLKLPRLYPLFVHLHKSSGPGTRVRWFLDHPILTDELAAKVEVYTP